MANFANVPCAFLDCRSDPSCHQEVQEHLVRDQQARRLQEPGRGHLHRLWRGQDRGSLAASSGKLLI